MEKRLVPCPSCTADIPVDVSQENIGKTVTVACLGCKDEFQVIVESKENVDKRTALRKRLASEIVDILQVDGRLDALAEKYRSEGYIFSLVFGAEIRKLSETSEDDDSDVSFSEENEVVSEHVIEEPEPRPESASSSSVKKWHMLPQQNKWNN